MAETVKDPQQLFAFKLGVALSLERTVLSTLRAFEPKATDPELKEGLSTHARETEQQIRNLEQAFSALGIDPTGHQSPAADGLKQEGQQLLDKVDESLVDAVIVGAAAATEHHEIATYEGLITKAEAMGEDDVVALLQENLEQEQNMLQRAQQKAQQLAQQVTTTAR